MKTSKYLINIDGKSYDVVINHKRQRNIYFRLKENTFSITAPYLTSDKYILENLEKYAPKLLKRKATINQDFSFEEDYIYLLGKKESLSTLNIKNNRDLQEFLKVFAKQIFTESVRKYEEIMGIEKPYKVTVKNTTTQLGSNSKKTHTLSFQIRLVHYSREILESVVVHELAHEFERNHQKSFYNIVYKFCPNYYILTKKIKKGIRS